jgi:hypothetical protein
VALAFRIRTLKLAQLFPLRLEAIAKVTSPLLLPETIEAHLRESRPQILALALKSFKRFKLSPLRKRLQE